MCQTNYCGACDFELRNPGHKAHYSHHTCWKNPYPFEGPHVLTHPRIGHEQTIFAAREPMGRDTGKLDIETANQHRYSLDELWPYRKFVKPIRELSTPHLRNIVLLFKDGTKLQEIHEKDGFYAHINMQRRIELVRKVLAERDANLQSKVYNARIRADGMVKKVERLYPSNIDLNEVRSVFKHMVEVLEEVEHALSKVDE